MTLEEKHFLQAVYAKAERSNGKKQRLLIQAACVAGSVALAVLSLFIRDNMALLGLASGLILALLSGLQWMRLKTE